MPLAHHRGSPALAPGRPTVLQALRSSTAAPHQRVERSLGLISPRLTPRALGAAVVALERFFGAAQAGLDRWALACPAEAAAVQWPQRRRLGLFGDDVAALDVPPADPRPAAPVLPAVSGTGQALGRLYVLEGSSLGGQVINRAFAARLPDDPLVGVRLRGLDPYGDATGMMWRALRQRTTTWASTPPRQRVVVAAAVSTFAALDTWCLPLWDGR